MNVQAAIKKAGSPSLYRLGKEMAEIMKRPIGLGFDKYGPGVNSDTCRKHVEQCLANQRTWRVDYLEAVSKLTDVSVVDLVSSSKLRR